MVMAHEIEMKSLTIRMSKELWRFLKKKAFDKEISVNTLMVMHLEKIKIKAEKALDD